MKQKHLINADEFNYKSRIQVEAFLEVGGEIITTALVDAPYVGDAQVGFVNNGIMALFRSASYSIDGREIETIQYNVDVAITIIGLALYSDDYTRSAGPTMMFAKENSDRSDGRPSIIRRPINAADNVDADVWPVVHNNPDYNLGFRASKLMLSGDRRRFLCAIPMSHIFGFCRGVQKVIFRANHTVVLYRKGDDDDAIWRAADLTGADHANGMVVLSKLALWMPVVSPSIAEEQRLLYCMDTGGKSLI